jgi:ectoine hydroxylase-related dioxygenase (phytanoyl-CoA dioxygenase family)
MLTSKQIDEFDQLGLVRLPGAVPSRAADAMCDRVWQALHRKHQIERNDPDTWRRKRFGGTHHLPKTETFPEVGSPQIRAALDDLLGADNWEPPKTWGALLVAFPESRDRWEVPHQAWHLDYPAIRPREKPFAVRVFTCLAKLEAGGGGTLFLTGSHRLAQELVEKRGAESLRSREVSKGLTDESPWVRSLRSRDERVDRARFMQAGAEIDGIPIQVVEMTGEPGDVVLAHPMIVHSASTNCRSVPRIVVAGIVHTAGWEG